MMLSCRETSRLLAESMATRLPLRKRLALGLHMLLCKLCRRAVRQVAAIEEVARGYGARTADSPPASLGSISDEARERMKSALRDAR